MNRLRDGRMQAAAFFGPAIVALALAVLGGARVWQAASVGADPESGVAIALGAGLFLCLWGWYRARPGTGDAPPPGTIDAVWVGAAPEIALLIAAMLLGILPRVFWPADGGIHLAGSIASKTVMAGFIVVQVRRIVIALRRRRVAESSR